MLTVRSEVIEYGSLPTAPWMVQLDSVQALQRRLRHLLQLADQGGDDRGFLTVPALATALDITTTQTKILTVLLSGLVESPASLCLAPDSDEVVAVEVTCLTLYLVVAYYLCTASKADTADVWPADLFSSQHEPSSPMRLISRAWGRDQQPQHRAHLPSVRQHLSEHLAIHEALVKGFRGFVCAHLALLLEAVGVRGLQGATPGPDAMDSEGGEGAAAGRVSAAQLDRLGFLIAQGPPSQEVWGLGEASPTRGSPMDICATPTLFQDAPHRLSSLSPFFHDPSQPDPPALAVAGWLAESLGAEDLGPGAGYGDPGGAASPPPPPSAFNQLVSLASPSDLQSLHKATVVRGEDDFPGGAARVLDCHDCIVYALAPLRHALISCCTDCLVVVGAVGCMLRVERCERVQVVAAARAATVNTCHDCILHLGVNREPLLAGDNRFVQLAPYNAGYERLEAHAALAGVAGGRSLWDSPLAMLPEHRRDGGGAGAGAGHAAAASDAATAGSLHSASSGGSSASSGSSGSTLPSSAVPGGAATVSLLPPAKLVPFVVPFRGAGGPLAGGPPLQRDARSGSDPLSAFLDSGEGGGSQFPASPFPLPQQYFETWEAKMAAAGEVRAAVKEAALEEGRRRELMAAIQASFKDWLQSTGSMRHVYDIARMERAEAGTGSGGRG
uniref:TBCC domain-containing protein 1 n=1 Tax=Auxenochlorella protothecoides TaxID=3075 RepID=A0A1D1ZXZ4_AUXPR